MRKSYRKAVANRQVQDVRELAGQHPGRAQEVAKDGAATGAWLEDSGCACAEVPPDGLNSNGCRDARSVLEHAAFSSSTSSALNTLSRTALTLSTPSHLENDDARAGAVADLQNVVPIKDLGMRPRRLNRLYLKSLPTTGPRATHHQSPVAPAATSYGPDSGAAAAATPNATGFNSSGGGAWAGGSGSQLRSSSSGSSAPHSNSSSGGFRRSKRLAPVDLRVATCPVVSQHGTGGAGAAAGGTPGTVFLRGPAEAPRDRPQALLGLLGDEGEQSVTVAADSEFLAEAHGSISIPTQSPPSESTSPHAAAAVTVVGPSPACPRPPVAGDAGTTGFISPVDLRLSLSFADSVHGQGFPPAADCGGLDAGRRPALELGSLLPAAPSTPSPSGAVREPSDVAAGSLPHALDTSRSNAQPPSSAAAAAEAGADALPTRASPATPAAAALPATGGDAIHGGGGDGAASGRSCRVQMKLHSSEPKHLMPGMLAPLAKLLLPYGWAVRNIAVRRGCLELVLDYTRLDGAVYDTWLGAADGGQDGGGGADASVAQGIISDGQLTELVSYLHHQGLVDPSLEPSVTVYVNQHSRRVQWAGGQDLNGDFGGGGAPASAAAAPTPGEGPLGVAPSWCDDTAMPDGAMPPSTFGGGGAAAPAGAVLAAAAGPSAQPQASGGWTCHHISSPGHISDMGIEAQPEVLPVCVVAPCMAVSCCGRGAAGGGGGATPSTSASSALLYVAMPRARFHSCTVRCLGRFLPVQQLQHLSASETRDAADAGVPTGFPMGEGAVGDWRRPQLAVNLAQVAAAAAGDGDIFVVHVGGLPSHSALLQVELRAGSAEESWASNPTSYLDKVDVPRQPVADDPHHGAAGPAAQPPPQEAPPMYGAREYISAPAPVLLLRGCGACDPAVAEVGCGACICSLGLAGEAAAELTELRARVLLGYAAAGAATGEGEAAAAEAAGEFLNDLGLLLDATAAVSCEGGQEEAAPAGASPGEYPSYSRELRGLLVQQLGLANDATTTAGDAGDGGGGGVTALLQQHLADTAVTTLAGCLALGLPYTARLVVSCATRWLRVCSLEVLAAAVAADGAGGADAALAALLQMTTPPAAWPGGGPVGIRGGGGGGGAPDASRALAAPPTILPAPAAAAAAMRGGLPAPPLMPAAMPTFSEQDQAATQTPLSHPQQVLQAVPAAAVNALGGSDSGTGPEQQLAGHTAAREGPRSSPSASALQDEARLLLTVPASTVASAAAAGRVAELPTASGPISGPELGPHQTGLGPWERVIADLRLTHTEFLPGARAADAAAAAAAGQARSRSPPIAATQVAFSGPLVPSLSLPTSTLLPPPLPPPPSPSSSPQELEPPLLPTQQQEQMPSRYRRFLTAEAEAGTAALAADCVDVLAAATLWLTQLPPRGTGRSGGGGGAAVPLTGHVQHRSVGAADGATAAASAVELLTSIEHQPPQPPPQRLQGQPQPEQPQQHLQQRPQRHGHVSDPGAMTTTAGPRAPSGRATYGTTPRGTAAASGSETSASPPPSTSSTTASSSSSGTTAVPPAAAPTVVRQFLDQVLVSFSGFRSPQLEHAFWEATAARLQTMCRLYALITLVFVSLTGMRSLVEDGAAAAGFMTLYQGGQALLLAAFGALGDGRPERLFATVAAGTVLRAVCHAALGRGLAPLPSFVLPVARLWVDVFNEGVAKAVFEQTPAWLFFTLLVFLELPTSYALMSHLDGHGRGLLTCSLPLRLACLAVLKTAVVLGSQAAWRLKFLARRRSSEAKAE